jgi:hypothetical protein
MDVQPISTQNRTQLTLQNRSLNYPLHSGCGAEEQKENAPFTTDRCQCRKARSIVFQASNDRKIG